MKKTCCKYRRLFNIRGVNELHKERIKTNICKMIANYLLESVLLILINFHKVGLGFPSSSGTPVMNICFLARVKSHIQFPVNQYSTLFRQIGQEILIDKDSSHRRNR